MKSRGSRPTRREITDRGERASREMRDIEAEAGIVADDHGTINHTLENLECGGTQEGADEVIQSIEGAKDVTEQVFDDRDGQLDRVQDAATADKDDVGERKVSAASDRDRIRDAGDRVRTRETQSEVARAREGNDRELDFLTETVEKALASLAESESVQQALRSRVYGGRAR